MFPWVRVPLVELLPGSVIGPRLFVPVTSPTLEWIVKTASKLSRKPDGVPLLSNDCGPSVAVPTSVYVPG
jgi:hypothetical protein